MAFRAGRQSWRRALRQAHRGVTAHIHTRVSSFSDQKLTNFGYKEVPEDQKTKLVGDVFSSVARNYDLMNDLMSVGLHRLWKDRLVSKLRPFVGMQHLDVAGGTGDVAFRVVNAIHRAEQRNPGKCPAEDVEAEDETRVFVCDINPAMLEVGKERARERGLGDVSSLVWMEGDAEMLSLSDNSMDGYTIAFGIRNVTHIDRALKEAHRHSSFQWLRVLGCCMGL